MLGCIVKEGVILFDVLFKLFLTINATSLIIVIYLIKVQQQIIFLDGLPRWISYIIYISIPIITTGISILLARLLLSKDCIEGGLKDVEQANNAFLPSYLGYFFVALSVPFYETLGFVFGILFVFTYFSQTLYFNPLFLIWGYQFYNLTTENNTKIFLISKKKIRTVNNLRFLNLRRINDFTYLDMEDDNDESCNRKD